MRSPPCARSLASCATACAEFVLADIPGLIAGAAEGAGAGRPLPGPIERCRVLIHLIDIHGTDPVEAMAVIEDELEAYGGGLEDKPRLIALNKIDLVDAELVRAFSKELLEAGADRVFPISGATGKGIDALLDGVLGYLPDVTTTERPTGAVEDAADAAPWSPLITAVQPSIRSGRAEPGHRSLGMVP